MKVCTFEPPLSCRACSRAKLSTSSLLFDRAILFMSPLTVANYRLDGTVMRCAGENLSTGCDLPLACRKHRSHIPFLHAPHNAWLILRRGNGCFLAIANLSVFFRQSPIYLFRLPELSVPRSGTGKGTTRSLVIIRNKKLQHREVEGRLLWLKRRGTRGWK